MTIILTVFLIIIYLISCIITWQAGMKLASSSNPSNRALGLKLLLLGIIVRFLLLLVACFNGFPFYLACIAQFLPIILISLLEPISRIFYK